MNVHIDQVVQTMITLRDEKAKLKEAYDREEARIQELMDRGEAWLLKLFADSPGVNSMNTTFGTVSIRESMRASIPDRGAFNQFVLSSGLVDLFEGRVSSTVLKAYIEQGNTPPPGVNVSTNRSVSIRRKTGT